MDVLFTPMAERHIDEIHRYITEQSGYESRADGFVARIVEFCEKLTLFPLRGTERNDLMQGLRVIGFERSVNIAFLVTDNLILIEGIYYGGRAFEDDF